MTRDEAMMVFRDAISAGQALAPFAGEEAAATVIQQAFAERDGEMRVALAPIMDWYQSDEHEPRKLADIAADAVADLQSDRADSLRDRGDAARYRWLRDESCPPHNFYVSVPDEFKGVRYSRADVDAYIDEARQALAAKGDSRG